MKSLSEIYDSIENPLNNTDNLRKATKECLKTFHAGNGNGFYDRIVKINGNEDNSQTNEEDKAKFLIQTTEEWRKNLSELLSSMSSEEINTNGKKEAIRYILSLGEITTIEQRNEVFKNLQSMQATNLFWEDHEGGWNHIMLNKISSDPSKNIVPKVTHRLYISCKKSDLFKMMTILKDKCDNANIPYYFKTMETTHRDDSIVIYSDTENLPNYLNVLDSIGQDYPEMVENLGNPPAMSGNYNGWIGFGDEPIDENGNGSQSYNEKRAQIMFDSILMTMKQEISDLKGKKISIEGKEVSFNNAVVSKFTDSYIKNCMNFTPQRLEYIYGVTQEDLGDRHMIYEGIKKNMSLILTNIFNGSDTSPSIKLPNGKTTSYKMELARENLSSLVPLIEKFDPAFLDKVKDSIENASKEKGIDIEKFCFDIGTKEKFEEEDKRREKEQKENTTEEVTESQVRKGKIQVYDEKGNMIIHEYINPDLLKRKIKLQSGDEISTKQFIQENFAPHIPESGTFKLKNGIEISARQYIEEFVMFELDKYNGDLEELMSKTLATDDVPPEREPDSKSERGLGLKQENGVNNIENTAETTSFKESLETVSEENKESKINMSSFKASLETKRKEHRTGQQDVNKSRNIIALRRERDRLSRGENLSEEQIARLNQINEMIAGQQQFEQAGKKKSNGMTR